MEPWKQELYHHGILGMRWGKRNGPPYPLSPGDHSASEKKAGWRKSLDRGSNEKSNSIQKVSKEQLIKIGKAAAITGIVAIGAYTLYKTGALDGSINIGKRYIDYTISKFSKPTNITESQYEIFNRIKNSEFKGDKTPGITSEDFFNSFEQYAKEKLFDINTIEKANSEEVKSIKDYTGDSYKDINKYLRGFKPIISNKEKINIKNIESFLNKMKIPEDTVVHRGASQTRVWDMLGLKLKSTTDPSDLIGREFVDKGFFSSSISPFSAFKHNNIMGKSKYLQSTQIHTYIPKGTKGSYIAPLSLKPSELEVLLQRGSKFKVIDATFDNGKIINQGLTDLYVLLIDQV